MDILDHSSNASMRTVILGQVTIEVIRLGQATNPRDSSLAAYLAKLEPWSDMYISNSTRTRGQATNYVDITDLFWWRGIFHNSLTKLEPRSNVKVMFATVGSGVKLRGIRYCVRGKTKPPA